MTGEKIEVEIIVTGYLKSICGFEKETLSVPQGCPEAFRYVSMWLNDKFDIKPSSVYMMFNDKNANDNVFSDQSVKHGDIFRILPFMSGG